MGPTGDQLETQRLVIRRFTPDDSADVLELGRDKESSEGGKYDHPWPTSEEGCRGAVEFCSANERFWAVCLKGSRRVIGLLALSSTEEPGTMEVGHVFHTEFLDDDLDTEALACIMNHAFSTLGSERIICQNAEEWTGQLRPLRKLGLKVVDRGDGTDFFQRDADGNPITFVGCRMATTRNEWLRLRGAQT